MNKRKIRFALNTVVAAADRVVCEDLHHPKKWAHERDEVCPAEYNIQCQIHTLQEFMKEQGV